MSYASVFTSSHSQDRWREHMKYNYKLDHDISPCVLQVPESLRSTKPEAYAPQIVGLGPYHHFRPEVQQMEREKRAAVISYLKDKEIKNIENLVDKYSKGSKPIEKCSESSEPIMKCSESSKPTGECPESFEPTVRSCYDGYLDLDKETLAWVVIVDGLFLMHFLPTYLGKQGWEEEKKKYSNIEALIPDIMMLENQIPFILMGEARRWLGLSVNNIEFDRAMKGYIHDFCKMHSPLQFASDQGTRAGADQSNHMMHYMYTMIVENQSQTGSSQSQTANSAQSPKGFTSRVAELAKEFGLQASGILEQAIEEYYTHADSKSGLKVPENVEKVSHILRKLQEILHLDHIKGSLGNQIDIPSASRLKALLKLKFKPLPDNCGIGDIKLEDDTCTLHLPVITLDSNSEVILRNLIAYESTSKMRSTKLRDYMDLICGLIKYEKDVTLLTEEKIIINKGQLSDAEIARMCNGITKSFEKSDVNSKVHQTVTAVKEKFNNKGVVKACRSTMKCFAALVKSIKPILLFLVVLFLAWQSFCETYDCRRSSYGGAALRNSYSGELELDPKSKIMPPRKVYRY